MFFLDELLERIADRSQLGQYNQGAQGGAGRATATEAAIVQQNSQIRVDERRDVVGGVYSAVLQRALQMVWLYWNAPQAARVAGPDGLLYWVQFTGRDIRGEYDFEVDAEDAVRMDREIRRAQANDAYDRLIQLPPEMVRHEEVLRQWTEAYEFLDADRLLTAPAGMPGAMPLEAFSGMWEQPPEAAQGLPAAEAGAGPMLDVVETA